MASTSPRRAPPSSRWPGVSLLLLAAAAVAAAPALERLAGTARLCVVQAAAGIPCPLCGGTRAIAALARGGFVEALWWNPLAALGLMLAAPLGIAMTSGWSPPAAWRGRLRLSVVAAAAAMNWAYLLVAGR